MQNSNWTSRQIYHFRVNQVVTFIDDHLDDELSLEQLAQVAHFSPYHFHRIFSAIVGETPNDFINRLRLERSAHLLIKAPASSITQIALSSGFSSSATFARAFKKYFGMTASQYRRRYMGKGVMATPALRPDRVSVESEPDTASLPPFEVEIKTFPALHMAYVANLKGYDILNICETWDKLSKWALANGLMTPQAKMVGVSFDDPAITPEDKCRYYACITVPEERTFGPQVGILDIPGGKCAVCSVTCDAEQIQPLYHAFYRTWLPDSGFQPDNYPCYEIYYAAPDTNPAGKFILDICFPIMPLQEF